VEDRVSESGQVVEGMDFTVVEVASGGSESSDQH
jgi:hypothetical protein